MKIYQIEKIDGLEEIIKSSASIKIDIPLTPTNTNNLQLEIQKAKASSNPDQIDLYYIDSILVSTGWSINDDVFDNKETWKARNTPVDKPFNFMHDGDDIIGHITGSFAIDRNCAVIEDNVELSNLPTDYDIITSAVIYKYWPTEERTQEIQELISGIEEGKWFVSMECLFPNFDYAIIDKDGNQKIIDRNEETAFLSKYLKAYGGTGTYNDYRVGRLLRNFTFSGKGLVDKPANPRSIIFNDFIVFDGCSASIHSITNTKGNEIMPDNINNDLQKEIERLRNELAVASELNGKLKAKADEEAKKSYEEKIVELEAEIASIKSELEEKNNSVAELTASLNEKSQAVASKDAELTSIKAEMVKIARSSKLANAGVESEQVETILTKFASATDEMFEEVVALYTEAKTAKNSMKKEECSKSESKETEKVEEKVEEIVEVEETKAGLATAGESTKEDSDNMLALATASLKNHIFKSTRK